MGDSSTQPKHTVLVTGFGPFGNHVINASWVAVQELEKLGLGEDINLITHEIPVEYDTVKETVPSLWRQYKPKLMVHIGVSGVAKNLTLEQQAHNQGYDKFDVKGVLPTNSCCIDDGPKCLVSKIDMRKVCDEVNKSNCGVDSVISMDPGRYLCDFTYFTSLNINCGSSAFIHVPPLNKPFSAIQLAEGLRVAILAMLLHVRECTTECREHTTNQTNDASAELLKLPVSS